MRRGWLLVPALALALVACSSSEPAVPEGYQLVEHPEATVAVPEEWSPGDPGDLIEADPDIVDMRIPDPPGGEAFGVRLDHYDRTMNRTFRSAEEPTSLEASLLPQTRDQTRREEVEIAGATEGFLLQLEAQGSLVEDPVRFTYVVGLREDGSALMLSIVGTAEQIPDEVIETMVETFTLTEPVPLPSESLLPSPEEDV